MRTSHTQTLHARSPRPGPGSGSRSSCDLRQRLQNTLGSPFVVKFSSLCHSLCPSFLEHLEHLSAVISQGRGAEKHTQRAG